MPKSSNGRPFYFHVPSSAHKGETTGNHAASKFLRGMRGLFAAFIHRKLGLY
jgi:hypothetical protein